MNPVKPRTKGVPGDVTRLHSCWVNHQPCGTGCTARLCSLPLVGRSSHPAHRKAEFGVGHGTEDHEKVNGMYWHCANTAQGLRGEDLPHL